MTIQRIRAMDHYLPVVLFITLHRVADFREITRSVHGEFLLIYTNMLRLFRRRKLIRLWIQNYRSFVERTHARTSFKTIIGKVLKRYVP